MYSTVTDEMSAAERTELRSIVDDFRAVEAVVAAAEAERARILARAGALAASVTVDQVPSVKAHDMALRAIAAELAVPMHMSDRSLQRQIDDAGQLVEQYPATLAARGEGRLTRAHVRVVMEAGSILPPEKREAFDRAAVRHCEATTPARAHRALALLAERMHPRTLTERHVEARETRGLRVEHGVDGISDLIARMPTLLADAVFDRATQQARALIDLRANPPDDIDDETRKVLASDHRTLDQLRADILADMMLTSQPGADPTRTDDGPGTLGAIRAKVQVVVPVLSLLGGEQDPAELAGRAPMDAETARRLAGATRCPWERVLTHPITGAVLHTDTYQRTAAIDRHLRARDQHCRFPGCRVPAVRCEVDHTHDYALGGRTRLRNLAHLCQRHHSMKQFTAWAVRQLDDGVLEWTSPLGEVYDDSPPDPVPAGVRFAPDVGEAEPPPV
ncbi:MAG: DUF222 domain-containing protein [Microbacterium sp.]|uniref:HNH endonuclease signature motif containing protein n=1 Tax=Microbacterium sp. TaxID=51671 RepID=UPI0039E5EB51